MECGTPVKTYLGNASTWFYTKKEKATQSCLFFLLDYLRKLSSAMIAL